MSETHHGTYDESPDSPWRGNFRDLNAAVTRLVTLADQGRIRLPDVEAEIDRLQANWGAGRSGGSESTAAALEDILSEEQVEAIDPFDRVQLAYVIEVCRQSPTLSAAGRTLFSVSRTQKAKPNDSDRLRKYLAKYDISFSDLLSE